MGYACPVCDVPQADDEHLANHLAFTAVMGDDEHEAWLDEHAPDWGQMGPDELAPIAVEAAEETEYEEVFEDTTGRHDHDHGDDFDERMVREAGRGGRGAPAGGGELDEEAREILREAHEMTEEMYPERTSDADDGEDGDGSEESGGETATEREADAEAESASEGESE